MKLLLDTQLLLWVAEDYELLSKTARELMHNADNELFFSALSIWEVAIKFGLGRPSFRTRPQLLRRGLIEQGYKELAFTSEHTFALEGLLQIHKDPFDRGLLAQAITEGILLLTTDQLLSEYAGVVRLV